jgi:mutator protein MutT
VTPEVAVGAVVVDGERILLVRRAQKPGLGQWSVPGGRVEPGERMHDALVREVAEETGLSVEVGDLAGWVERIDAAHHFVILDFFARVVGDGVEPRPGTDVDRAQWVPFAALDELDVVTGLREFLHRAGIPPSRFTDYGRDGY